MGVLAWRQAASPSVWLQAAAAPESHPAKILVPAFCSFFSPAFKELSSALPFDFTPELLNSHACVISHPGSVSHTSYIHTFFTLIDELFIT